MNWFWSRRQKKSQHAQKKQEDEDEDTLWDTVEERTNDPRLGKRVFCLSLLPEFEVYGTIVGITRSSNKNELPSHAREYWNVVNDHGMGILTLSQYFELYEQATEFQRGDRVRYLIDEGGYWEGVILCPILDIDQLRFVVKIENVQTRIKISSGSEEAYPPSHLLKI